MPYSYGSIIETADQGVEPYIPYAEYSTQENYAETKKANDTYITGPYEDVGYTMVTFYQPIIVNNQMIGIVTADINKRTSHKVYAIMTLAPCSLKLIRSGSAILSSIISPSVSCREA